MAQLITHRKVYQLIYAIQIVPNQTTVLQEKKENLVLPSLDLQMIIVWFSKTKVVI